MSDCPICFIAGGNLNNAGSRLRAYWPARFIPGAAVVHWERAGDDLPDARAYVFQKFVNVPVMASLRERGRLIFWDVCDPAWWFNPTDAREALAYVDGVVASSWPLADDYTRWSGRKASCIPDRLLLEHYDRQRRHAAADPVRLIWFGAAQNRMALYAAHANLERLVANGYRIALTICDNAPNAPFVDIEGVYPVYYTRWALESEAATLAAHDIALLPPYPGPWGAVKSNNKPLTAMACGLPSASGVDYSELRALVADEEARADYAADGRRLVEEFWNVERSAAEWLALIEETEHGRNSEVHRTAAIQV